MEVKNMPSTKDIRKKRTLIYFIEAAQKIMEEEGEEKVTIRKVANLAGYNSATLYNYFDDLDHLKLYASLKYLNLYNAEVAEHTNPGMTERERLTVMWEVFGKLSFAHPKEFIHIFFDKHSCNLEDICRKYYDLFPEEMDSPIGKLPSVELYLSLTERSRLALRRICEEENLSDDKVNTINELLVLAYKGLLFEQAEEKSEDKQHYYAGKLLTYFHYLLNTL